MSERKSFSHRTVFIGLGVSLLAAVGVASHIYTRYVRFEPVAERHLPKEAELAVRLNVEQAVVYQPFREHVLSSFETGRPRTGPLARETRLAHFERETSIELGVDLREVVLAEVSDGDWLLLLAGHFRRDGVAAGTQRMLSQEGIETQLLEAPERVVHPSGVTFAVSSDGVLVLASSEELCLEALAPRSPPRFASEAALELFLSADSRKSHLIVLPGQTFPVRFTSRGVAGEGGDREGPPPGAPLLGSGVAWAPESAKGVDANASATLNRAEFDDAVLAVGGLLRGWLIATAAGR